MPHRLKKPATAALYFKIRSLFPCSGPAASGNIMHHASGHFVTGGAKHRGRVVPPNCHHWLRLEESSSPLQMQTEGPNGDDQSYVKVFGHMGLLNLSGFPWLNIYARNSIDNSGSSLRSRPLLLLCYYYAATEARLPATRCGLLILNGKMDINWCQYLTSSGKAASS